MNYIHDVYFDIWLSMKIIMFDSFVTLTISSGLLFYELLLCMDHILYRFAYIDHIPQ